MFTLYFCGCKGNISKLICEKNTDKINYELSITNYVCRIEKNPKNFFFYSTNSVIRNSVIRNFFYLRAIQINKKQINKSTKNKKQKTKNKSPKNKSPKNKKQKTNHQKTKNLN
jgi:hypothetical protein